MPAHGNTLMKQSETANDRYVRDSLNLFRRVRAVGNNTDFVKKNKNEAREFSIFRYLTHKHSSTGRFGAKKAEEASDTIKAMESAGETPEKSYFDPFGMRIIKEQDDAAQNPAGEDAAPAQAQDDLSAETMEAEQVEDDFVNRVDEEIYLNILNDFEAERSGIDARLAFAQGMDKKKGQRSDRKLLKDTSENYHAGKAFIPDYDVIETVPDSFNMELVVDEAPPKYSLEWMQYQAEQTEGVLGKIKGFFRKAFNRPQPTEDTMFENFVQTLPEYKKLVSDGKRDAKAAGIKDYDPALDTAVQKFKSETKDALDQNGQNLGHSSVRMNARKYGAPVSTYSFMFASTANPGMAGTIKGVVANPAYIKGGEVKSKFDIRYPDYLRAAAKIRGTVGSMRTYSLIGYNCSSFASEVAKAAGVPIKDEDTSSYVMTHRHHSQKVDSPYKIARMIVERNELQDKAKAADPAEQALAQSVDAKKTALMNTYLRQFAGTNVVSLIRRRHLFEDDDIQDSLESLIEDIVDSGAEVDRAVPVDNLTGAELTKAQQNRVNGRKLAFKGEVSEDAFLQRYLNDGNLLAGQIIEYNLTDSFEETFFGPEIDPSKKDKIRAAMIPTRFYNRHYMHLNPMVAIRKLDHLIDTVASKQKEIRTSVMQLLSQSNGNYDLFLRGLDTLLGPYELDMLGDSVLVKGDTLTRFLNAANLSPYGEDLRPEEPPAAAPAAAASAPAGAAHEEANAKSEAEAAEEKKPEEKPAQKPVAEAKPAAEEPHAAAQVEEKKAVQEEKPALPPGVVLEEQKEEPLRIKTPEEMNKTAVKKLVFSLDKEPAIDRFIEVFSSSAHIEGYSMEKGTRMTRGDMIRVLSNLATDRDANSVMLKHYDLILRDTSAEGKLYLFESMLRDTAAKFPMSILMKAFEDNGIS